MNYRQRFYDSYNTNNMNLKITNSYYHFKNIQSIIYRKPEYKVIKKINSPKININTRPFNNYFIARENELYKKIINDIRTTKTRPKLNDYYKLKEEKLRDYRKKYKTLENRQLSRENINFQKRLRNQKSMLRIRDMDKDYKTNHVKIMERSRRIKDLRSIMLPPISTIVNRINSTKKNRNLYNDNTSVSKGGESLRQYKKKNSIDSRIQSTQ
jgi:hypothetical protein